MLRREELLWFYQEGASFLFPDFWEDFLAPIPEVERGDLISAYYRRLTGENEEEKLRCAKAWSTWEMVTGRLSCDPDRTIVLFFLSLLQNLRLTGGRADWRFGGRVTLQRPPSSTASFPEFNRLDLLFPVRQVKFLPFCANLTTIQVRRRSCWIRKCSHVLSRRNAGEKWTFGYRLVRIIFLT